MVGDPWQRTDQSTTSAVLADGGIHTSFDVIARWDASLYDERLRSNARSACSACRDLHPISMTLHLCGMREVAMPADSVIAALHAASPID